MGGKRQEGEDSSDSEGREPRSLGGKQVSASGSGNSDCSLPVRSYNLHSSDVNEERTRRMGNKHWKKRRAGREVELVVLRGRKLYGITRLATQWG